MPTREDARRALQGFARNAQYANWQPALMALIDGTYKVPGEDLTYVRVVHGDTPVTVTRARNHAGIPETVANVGLPVWIAQTIRGEWIIKEPRNSRQRGVATSTANVSSPPTAAELTGAFGDPDDLGDGFVGVVDDNAGGTAIYVCYTISGLWAYEQLTVAV